MSKVIRPVPVLVSMRPYDIPSDKPPNGLKVNKAIGLVLHCVAHSVSVMSASLCVGSVLSQSFSVNYSDYSR